MWGYNKIFGESRLLKRFIELRVMNKFVRFRFMKRVIEGILIELRSVRDEKLYLNLVLQAE